MNSSVACQPHKSGRCTWPSSTESAAAAQTVWLAKPRLELWPSFSVCSGALEFFFWSEINFSVAQPQGSVLFYSFSIGGAENHGERGDICILVVSLVAIFAKGQVSTQHMIVRCTVCLSVHLCLRGWTGKVVVQGQLCLCVWSNVLIGSQVREGEC